MMLDGDIVACSPASVYRVLKKAGLLAGQAPKPTKKGTGFVQPLRPHEHWHVDVSHLNIAGTFYFLCTILDGCSRFIVHWEIREKMEETDVETIIQRAREAYPDARPRIISDNGPQFIAKDFKEFIRKRDRCVKHRLGNFLNGPLTEPMTTAQIRQRGRQSRLDAVGTNFLGNHCPGHMAALRAGTRLALIFGNEGRQHRQLDGLKTRRLGIAW